MKKAAAFAAALGVVIAGASVTVPASAEPVSGGYTIVGSDTLEAAVNALVNGTSISGSVVRVTGGGNPIGNYDAFPNTGVGSTIMLKPSTPWVTRPSGSGDGKKSLSRSIDGAAWTKNGLSATITGLVDLARSSSGAGTGANGGINASGPLLFVPFGRDAVSYAFKVPAGTSAADITAVGSLTAAQLTQIYGNAAAFVVPGTSLTVVPKLPQGSSGTRQFFLGALGLGSTSNPPGVADASTTTLAENDATLLAAPAAGTVTIIPFSAAAWIAQSNGATATNTTAGANLGAIGGVAAFTGSGTNLVPNGAFYNDVTFGRDTYIIVAADKVVDSSAATYDANLAALVDQTKITSLTYFGGSGSPATSKAVKLKFGFLAPLSSATFRTNLFS